MGIINSRPHAQRTPSYLPDPYSGANGELASSFSNTRISESGFDVVGANVIGAIVGEIVTRAVVFEEGCW